MHYYPNREASVNQMIIDLKKNYINPSHPIAFSGISNIFKYYNGRVPINKIKQALAGFDSYTLHKEVKKFQRNPSYSYFKRHQFQIDLVEIRLLSKYNKGNNYLLNCIDTFTRYGFSRPLKNKSAESTLNGFKSILKEAKSYPKSVCSDKGAEIKNKQFYEFCKKNNIKIIHNETSVHAAYVERFNRTLQKIIYRYMTQYETKNFVDKLQDLVKSYNSRVHRMIGTSPIEAEKSVNHKAVRSKVCEYYAKFRHRKPGLKKNQLVRITKTQSKFSRGYEEGFKEEVFRINNISTRLPFPLYILETYDKDEVISGKFYEFELTPVEKEYFQIEKILETKGKGRNKQYLVKWRGYNKSQWIKHSDLKPIN